MPKFVSESSGNLYAHGRSGRRTDEDEDDEAKLLAATDQQTSSDQARKPSAINNKGTKEKQKNSLDLFKEELRLLNEEREGKRQRQSSKVSGSGDVNSSSSHNLSLSSNARQANNIVPSVNISSIPPVPVPLKPDPRCQTSLTLQVNLNPKDRDSSMSGSFDTGDPNTTNIYLGNVNPTVNENDLCDIFGRFGPLASIKIMWPRTDEERARNRNSGFVAFMSRIDAERAIKALNGKDIRGYDMKLGWGKAVPLPHKPVYIPPALIELNQPPPISGLPFNAQLDDFDAKRNYKVPQPYPKPIPVGLEASMDSNEVGRLSQAFKEFSEVLARSTVYVTIPQDKTLLDRIHKTIEYVLREGPVFEAIIIARENKNPAYSFLYDNQSPEHVYYRWKLYSLLHGDEPYKWRDEPFRMFIDGPTWRPPSLNPYANGMPIELLEKTTSGLESDTVDGAPGRSTTEAPNIGTNTSIKRPRFAELESYVINTSGGSRPLGSLGEARREQLGDLLRNLNPSRRDIGNSMMFCINHSDAAKEVIECIVESLKLLETPLSRKLARLFLISDILHNCSAAVTNASYYRQGFLQVLEPIFIHLREYLVNIEDRAKADKFKEKILNVLGAWKEWTLYEDSKLIKLSNILLGTHKQQSTSVCSGSDIDDHDSCKDQNLDGEEIDRKTLVECLEAKGLSLRWYMTLELSDDESDQDDQQQLPQSASGDGNLKYSARADCSKSTANEQQSGCQQEQTSTRFKPSKWETVDPDQVAEQVVTISKWDRLYEEQEEAASGKSDSSSDDIRQSEGQHGDPQASNEISTLTGRFRAADESRSSSSSSLSSPQQASNS